MFVKTCKILLRIKDEKDFQIWEKYFRKIVKIFKNYLIF